MPTNSIDELLSPVRRPAHFQWEPNHFQRTMGLIPRESEYYKDYKGGKTTRAEPIHSVTKPPFGLDFERKPLADEELATGYKKGGPKEARLFRVALLRNERECDHLFGVKVVGIPDLVQEKELADVFQRFGKIGNIYVPRDGASRKAVTNFAVVRFIEKESASRALQRGSVYVKCEFCGPEPYLLFIEDNPSQESTFTQNSGVHGITNKILDSMIQEKEYNDSLKEVVEQNIALDECFSRSGYPWGSKRELKILESHAPRDVLSMHTIRLDKLNQYTHPKEIKNLFNNMNLHVGDVYCPRPLHVNLRLNDGRQNDGFGYLRFQDARDLHQALEAINAGLISFNGDVCEGKVMKPFQWPTDFTRRYF
jgi:hypothetical protein